MDLSKYINALKEIPKRFGNVSYHYWDKKVSDNVADSLDIIQNYSNSNDNAINGLEVHVNAIDNTIAINGYGHNQHSLNVTQYVGLQTSGDFAFITKNGDYTFSLEYSAAKCKTYNINNAYVDISLIGAPSVSLPAKFNYITAEVSDGKGIITGQFAGCNAILPALPAGARIASANLIINCNYTR